MVLAVPTEAELERERQRLAIALIPHVPIYEPDLADAMTAIGVVPCQREAVRKLLRHLRNYR